MGRRKIEIRAIKDDRNRSVTFLKRKGGLFKKAHELSVLCSVDVAVIIFGHNKKLYEFSSGDINETLRRYQYYGPPHEHKGPVDFRNKGGDDDDEDEEDEDLPMQREDSLPPQHGMMAPHLQHHNSFQHIRVPGPSASPPMPNGIFQPQRNGTPQPPQIGSRPSSRNTVRRPSSNLVPMQHPNATPTPPQNGFAYAPNPPIYNAATSGPPPQPSPQPSQFQPSPQPSQFQLSPQPPQFHFQHQSHTPQPPPSHSPFIPEQQQQQQQQQQQSQAPQPSPPRNTTLHPPPQPARRASPQPQQSEFRSNEHMTPPQIKHLSSKSRSIFTPIDEGGSVLAQHFFGAPDPPRREVKRESPPDLKRLPRTATHPPQSKPNPPPRTQSGTSFRPPTRSDTGGSKSGARPKLNLQIPSEASDGEQTSISPNARSAVNSANPARDGREHHGIVLPPPSPSASAVLSAGASGPPNPFARPPPPTSNNNNNQNSTAYAENRNNNLETPISALPSRYMDRDLLASPGGIFGSWDNFGGGGHVLPSPNISTPADGRLIGQGWGRADMGGGIDDASVDIKRKGDELVNEPKKVKT